MTELGAADDLTTLGAVELGGVLRRREASAVEATHAYLTRIKRLDPTLRAFITLTDDAALEEAERADARLDAGARLSSLDGVPVAVKDNIAVAGLPRTCGVKARATATAQDDAHAVTLLREAGAVILGTLNMHEGALGATTDNPTYGRCLNPWGPLDDAGWTPGGSSGGSGAAVAARLCAAALGTDTMGSVRIPAAYCGVFGFKPSYGRVPDMGLGHLSWSLDHIGPLARRAEDLRALMLALAQPHAAAGAQAPWEDWREYWVDEPLCWADLTCGVITADVDVEPSVATAFDEACRVLESLGATVRAFGLGGLAPGALRRKGLLIAEAEGAVAFAAERAAGGDGLSAEFAKLLNYGASKSAEDLAAAQLAVRRTRADIYMKMVRDGVDVLLSPTAPQAPFVHGTPAPANQADFTCLANFADFPAVSVPIGFAEGRPVGLQVMCGAHDDALILRIARQLETVFGAPPLAPV